MENILSKKANRFQLQKRLVPFSDLIIFTLITSWPVSIRGKVCSFKSTLSWFSPSEKKSQQHVFLFLCESLWDFSSRPELPTVKMPKWAACTTAFIHLPFPHIFKNCKQNVQTLSDEKHENTSLLSERLSAEANDLYGDGLRGRRSGGGMKRGAAQTRLGF